MPRTAALATALVLLHLLAAAAHGWTHARAGVGLSPWQTAFVRATVYALPAAAALLYWTPLRWAAAGLLTATMAAALAFGLYFHFVADTRDHVAHRDASPVGRLFVITAALLVPVQASGAAFGIWTWNRRGKPA